MNKTKARSRKAKKERNQTLKKTFLFAFLALGLFLLFIFGIVPLSLKILDIMDSGQGGLVNTDNIPPSAPSLSVPFEATNSAQIKVSGYTEPKAKVKLYLNAQEVVELTAGDDGQFETDLDLNEDKNELTAQAFDQAGNESPTSTTKVIIYDHTPPEIKITNAENDQEIVGKQNKDFKLEGETEPKAKVYINDRFTYADEEGKFTYIITLNEGDNHLKIKAVDPAGNENEIELNIKFKP